MKINKGKGKVHPSPSSSSATATATATAASKESTSALKLLPAAILALISVLSLEDKEVLAYLITRSLKATTNPSSLLEDTLNLKDKKSAARKATRRKAHNTPLFHCGCFDCYTSYWCRWDSSPNRDLIHQAIEAFEEHLATGELRPQSPKKPNNRGKRRERLAAARIVASEEAAAVPESVSPAADTVDVAVPIEPPVVAEGGKREELDAEEEEVKREIDDEVLRSPVSEIVRSPVSGSHKGLARKVLPDVIGLLNSRLWNLWNPNV